MNSFEAVFGEGAQNVAKSFVESGSRARTAVTASLEAMNRWAAAGWSAIPYKKPIAITSAVAVGLAAVLSEPAPSLNLSANVATPQFQSGSGGQNIPNNVHPMPRAIGSPTAPNLTSSQNRAHIAKAYNVNVSGRALGSVSPQALGNDLRSVMGQHAETNIRVTDQKRSLTAQSVADILGSG